MRKHSEYRKSGKTNPLLPAGRVFCIAVFLFVAFCGSGFSGESETKPKTAVLISRSIKPYIEAANGLSDALSGKTDSLIQLYSLDKHAGKGLPVLKESIEKEKFNLLVAVGPEAARFIWEAFPAPTFPKMFTMVLNPNRIDELPEDAPGISLNIPVEKQIQTISSILMIKKIGLLFDPALNGSFFRKAESKAEQFDVNIIPLSAGSRKEIPLVLKRNWYHIDGLWLIPDRTVITETIIKDYIMKESILKNRPVIGFNRFFYKSGAVLSFVFDYEEIGRQTGKLAASFLMDGRLESMPPVFQIWLNEKVARRMRLRIRPEIIKKYITGP